MQCLLKYPKQQYVVSQKLSVLLKYDARKYGAIKVVSSNINHNNEITRLCFPVSHRLYTKICKELRGFQSLFSKNDFSKTCTRNFSTNATNRQSSQDSNKQSSNESNKQSSKDSSGNSSKDPNKDDFDPIELVVTKYFLVGVLMFITLYWFVIEPIYTVNAVGWNDFVNDLLLKGKVTEIYVYPGLSKVSAVVRTNATFRGKRLFPNVTITDVVDVKDIEERIRAIEKRVGIRLEDGIPIRYISDPSPLTELIMIAILFGVPLLFLRRNKMRGKFNFFDVTKAKFTLVEPFSGKGVHFSDVAGLKEAKIEVMEFVDYLKNPERYRKLGAKVPKGALLLGPPGCGKTLLAKAVATESNVPFLSMNGSEFIEMIGGLGAARVRNLFAEAKKRAPSIIYIDEIDAIGKKRADGFSQSGDSESERTLNQLLVEMDGMTTSQDIIILASTNRAEVLDKALLRRGRFDRHILIDLPTLDERKQIFEYHLNSLSLEGKASQYAPFLAHLSPGFSGADIANVCNEAALHAATEAKTKVENSDLMYAIDKVLGGTVKKSSTLTPSEKKVVVYHEAGHALSSWLLEHISPLIKVTIVPRTNKRLGFTQYSDANLKLRSSENLFQNMCVLLGGRVAENIMFNKISTRAQNDLKKVTELAYRQVQQFGMSPTVGLISFDKEYTTTKTKKPYSKKLASLMDLEVRRIITEAYKTTEKLLLDNKDKLIILAEALLKKETLTYKEIEALIGPPPFGKKDVLEVEELVTEAK
ncbi:SPG7 matrix AAA peptidase subunit, paraplegin [Megachile rotundata]|uniref:SPG7 matrix AAA peptidase subunit, paraplegin n=1 Tax=Megachile rotundata TaxID=143995 RepID=UPI003FCF6B7E